MKKYRDTGAQGALLDEYEKAVNELISLIDTVKHSELLEIVDKETKDEDCRSIQTILTHVVRAGYTYVIEIRKHLGEDIPYKTEQLLDSIDAYKSSILEMFEVNLQLFKDYPKMQLEEFDNDKKMVVRWGQSYDPEQILEHAIVHILRHRRQIERFLQKMRLEA